MATEQQSDGFPELLRNIADGLSIHTRIASRYWLALALTSAVTVMPPQNGSISIPFLPVEATLEVFYPFAFVLISLLIVGYGSASCQGIRARDLAQRYIGGSKHPFLQPYDIHIQDVFDSIVSPSINRVAPLVQILQGKQQFFSQKEKRTKPSIFLLIYFTLLRVVSVLVVYALPGYALILAFIKSRMFSLSSTPWGIPVYLFWPIGIAAIVALLESFGSEISYFRKTVSSIWGTRDATR